MGPPGRFTASFTHQGSIPPEMDAERLERLISRGRDEPILMTLRREADDPAGGFRQVDMNVVGAGLEADRVLRVEAKDVAGHHVTDVSAIDLAPVLF
jgi:hypothetical protein